MSMPSLIELLAATDEKPAVPLSSAHYDISQITADSRQVKPGALFVALKGTQADGEKFIPEAIAAGAVAVLCEKNAHVSENVVAVRARNTRRVLAQIASAFYAVQPAHMVAVTGTDGKTSTADFFRQLVHGLGKPVASMGTLGVFNGENEELYPGANTTPDPVALHQMLADMAARGIDYACMEASSHGLHQHRLDGVRLQAAAFTNIARDHMDYHQTDEAYFAAKARLFDALLPAGGTAVINQDDAKFPALAQICAQRGLKLIGFGRNAQHLNITSLSPLPHGQRAELAIFGQRHVVDVPLLGGFQVMNILAALGLAYGAGLDIQKALALVPQLRGVPGRLELVATLPNGAAILIDYAHTPMALASILKVLRPHTHGKLHVVFGCGGNRDVGKRPQMGKIAGELADVAIVTDDNPRGENPALIRQAIVAASKNAIEVADRREAIYAAVKQLSAGDVLVIAGKGHEKYQIVGDKTYPFDDAVVARDAARELAA